MTHSEQELLEKTMNLIKVNLAYLFTQSRAKIEDSGKSISAIHNISAKLIDIGYKNYEEAVKITIPVGYAGIYAWEEELNNKMKRFINDSIDRWSKS